MYNKISSIILNSAKSIGLSDVFIAQLDALKESQAGKIFILAEIGGKKTEGQKIFDFLIAALSENYYDDEKILFKDKIPGLKIENIFEAAVTKTNRDLADFLVNERIKINPAATSLTIGVVYENKIHFANFGRNRALLVFRRGDEYEIINVEANAAEAMSDVNDVETSSIRAPKLFSSVISGEIPLLSYFVLSNEALPEYLSGKEMIGIITKLPPLAAAEQIKNVLSRVNTYIPFSGIIIKNTVGLSVSDIKEESEESSAHSSIFSLNYTEQKTERMLAPAGLVNLSGVFKGVKNVVKNWRAAPSKSTKRYARPEEDAIAQPPLDLGVVKSMSMISGSSPDRVVYKKRVGFIGSRFKNFGLFFSRLFSGRLWLGLGGYFQSRMSSVNKKNRLLFTGLGLAVIILIVSVAVMNRNQRRSAEEANFNSLIAAVNDKENEISFHLSYNDEAGAAGALTEAQALLASLPQDNETRRAAYKELSDKLASVAERLQKIVKVAGAEKVHELIGLNVNNIVFAAGKIYAGGGASVYALTPNSPSFERIEIKGASNIDNPQKDKDVIHYWDTANIVNFSVKTGAGSLTSIAGMEAVSGLTSFKIYGSRLYSVVKDKNQIYVYANAKDGFGAKTEWLKSSSDLSKAVDLGVDGDIYVLKSDGSVLKFYKNKAVDYTAGALSPVMTGADKLIVGTNYLYIFEPLSKRLAVLSKNTGALVNQYVVDSLVQPKDVAVDEAGKAAYFLDGEAVWKISLNQ